jgi:hypothetical protein
LAEVLNGIVSSYFDAWRRHDPDALRALLADDATFTGPLGQSANADEYRDAIGRMFAITTDVTERKSRWSLDKPKSDPLTSSTECQLPWLAAESSPWRSLPLRCR